ncbi:MAG: HEAT repeat domain-containing protein [Terriglobia bacterium]
MSRSGNLKQFLQPAISSLRPILMLGVIVALGAPNLGAQGGIELSFKLKDSSTTLHEPVWVECSIHNTLPNSISLDLGFNRTRNFVFTITAPNGTVTSPLQLGNAGFGLYGELSLPAGGVHTEEVLLNEWYPFPAEGNYLVRVKFTGPIRTEFGQTIQANREGEMELDIEPRNPKTLEEICRALTAAAVSPNAEAALRAGRTLSYVSDPIAVPFLGEVLRNSDFAQLLAAQGLGRIRTPEALRILRSRLNTEDPGLKAVIEGALSGHPGAVMD